MTMPDEIEPTLEHKRLAMIEAHAMTMFGYICSTWAVGDIPSVEETDRVMAFMTELLGPELPTILWNAAILEDGAIPGAMPGASWLDRIAEAEKRMKEAGDAVR